MNRKSFGSAMAQYAIIIGIIAVVLVPVFFVMGNLINDNFKGFSSFFSNADPQENNNTTNNIPSDTNINVPTTPLAGGSLGGTPQNPVKNCENGICTLDYGEFTLQGLPDNFTEIVETTGTSAGTTELAKLLDQMIAQMEGKVDPKELQEIKDLANMGHLIADYEQFVEEYAKTCDTKADPRLCMGDFLYRSAATYTPPSNLTNQLTGLTLDFSGPGNILEIGGSMNAYVNNKADFDLNKDTKLAKSFVDQYQEVMNNTAFSDTQKDIVKELYWQIGTMATELDNVIWSSGSGNYETDTYYDPITLEKISYDVTAFKPTDIYEPNYSYTTDLDSALICAAGYHSDTGVQCH